MQWKFSVVWDSVDIVSWKAFRCMQLFYLWSASGHPPKKAVPRISLCLLPSKKVKSSSVRLWSPQRHLIWSSSETVQPLKCCKRFVSYFIHWSSSLPVTAFWVSRYSRYTSTTNTIIAFLRTNGTNLTVSILGVSNADRHLNLSLSLLLKMFGELKLVTNSGSTMICQKMDEVFPKGQSYGLICNSVLPTVVSCAVMTPSFQVTASCCVTAKRINGKFLGKMEDRFLCSPSHSWLLLCPQTIGWSGMGWRHAFVHQPHWSLDLQAVLVACQVWILPSE